MKVTVCFGNVRVVVPCGDGELLVKNLTEKAISRYRKATGKPSDAWVTVHSLKSSRDGGIFDSDDCLNDVADDREQIIAIFEEQTSPLPHNNAGDGTSGSSVGTESPDLFRSSRHTDFGPSKSDVNYSITDVEIPDNGIPLGITPLQVRRGSEPALNRLSPVMTSSSTSSNNNYHPSISSSSYSVDPKRWSSAVAGILTEEDKNNNNSKPSINNTIGNYSEHCRSNEMLLAPPGDRGEGSGREEGSSSAFSRFNRDSVRLSMLSGDALSRWADAADRQLVKMQMDGRRDPVGGSATSPDPKSQTGFVFPPSEQFLLVALKNEDGPLGIHVVPDYDVQGREGGLTIQGIESGGRIFRDGRIKVGDKILEINEESLVDASFQQAQEIFKNALQSDELRLKLRKGLKDKKIPPPVMPKPQQLKQNHQQADGENSLMDNDDKTFNTKVATVSPTKKSVPNIPSHMTNTMLTANTRKIGKRIRINLTKGAEGLGFSITTRDNPAGGNCPIYIKNILPKGAAIRDGCLKSGDRLLEVNGIEMTGKSQNEAVTILRNTPQGGAVDLVVSRQEIVSVLPPEEPSSIPPNLPRQISMQHNYSPQTGYYQVCNTPSTTTNTKMCHEMQFDGSFISLLPSNLQRPGQMKNRMFMNADNMSDCSSLSSFHVYQVSGKRDVMSSKSEDSIFPWKQREVLTFDIPMSDTGSAGLGISVKGKTSTGPNGSVDLGIFVNVVINGGAASKDGRLKTNDQLVNVNGKSLLGMTNSEAMDTLRNSMCNMSVPNPDAITLTIARRIPSPNDSKNSSDAHSNSSTSENLISFDSLSPDTSENSENTVILHPKFNNKSLSSSKIEDKDLGLDTVFPNPVIDRLKGHTPNMTRGNDLYMRSNHDNSNNYQMQQSIYGSARRHDESGSLVAPTINLPSVDTVLVEDPYGMSPMKNRLNSVQSSNNSLIDKRFPSRDDLRPDGGPASPNRKPSDSQDFTFVSQLSLDDDGDVFARDGFGRQSMSEKRHAQLDARNTDTFQRTKKIREEREKLKTDPENKRMDTNDPHDERLKTHTQRSHSVKVPNGNSVMTSVPKSDYGPALGLKKSSSLESLHTLVHESQKQEDDQEEMNSRSASRGRGRGCNESFRAAVDRSYDAPGGQISNVHEAMETLDEESENGSNYGATNIQQYHRHHHHQHTRTAPGLRVPPPPASIPSNTAHDDMLNPYNRNQHYDKANKKKGIFKGFGHMFKFGKQKKGEDLGKHSQESIERQREQERLQARRAAQEEQERIQEQYKILVERQRQMEQQQIAGPANNQMMGNNVRNYPPQDHYASPPSRQERIYQLRAQHQRKHQERRGQYPQDEQEEQYERQIQEQVDRQNSRQHLYIKHYQRQIANQYTGKIYAQLPHKTPQHRRTQSQRHYQGSKHYQQEQPQINHHVRSNSYDPLKEMERPGSRKGFADPSPGRGKGASDQFDHYMNFEEIQYHMRQYEQHHPQHNNQRPSQQGNREGRLPPPPPTNRQNPRYREIPPSNYCNSVHNQQQRNPLQPIETNSFPRNNYDVNSPYNRPAAPMPPGSDQSNPRTPRHRPPEIPRSVAQHLEQQNIYGRTQPKQIPNQQSRFGKSPARPPQSFHNNNTATSPPGIYNQNSSYGSSSNSRDSSTPGSKV